MKQRERDIACDLGFKEKFSNVLQVYLSGQDVAESRDHNLDCVFLDYYDYHSMWHVFGR